MIRIGRLLSLALVLFTHLSLANAALQAIPSLKDSLKNIDGKTFKLADFKGPKGTLVIFSSNHCPYVKAWLDRIVEIGNDAAAKGIGVVKINSNDPTSHPADGYEEMQKIHKAKGMKFAYVVDGTSNVAVQFGATRTPEAFLFDAAGNLVYHGAIDDNSESVSKVTKHYLKDAVNHLAAGKPIPTKETKFIGCSIKFRTAKNDKTSEEHEHHSH